MFMFDKGNNLKKEDVVSCNTCGCLIKKKDTQKVDLRGTFIFDECQEYYCKSHKVLYDEVYINSRFERVLYKQLKVNELGEPLGYEKITIKEKVKTKD